MVKQMDTAHSLVYGIPVNTYQPVEGQFILITLETLGVMGGFMLW